MPGYLGVQNQINLWQNGIEKAIVVLAMAFVIINGEIDLSVASMMGLAAVVVARLWEQGSPIEIAILAALLVGLLVGLFNGFWVAIVGLPSLAVTLAGLIGFRGLGVHPHRGPLGRERRDRVPGLVRGPRSAAAQRADPVLDALPVIERLPMSMFVYVGLLVLAVVALGIDRIRAPHLRHRQQLPVARFSGVRVAAHKMAIFTISGLVAALAGVLYASHLGAVRGSTATGFELDIITIVLLGGVSIFGGSGTMLGVFLATFLVLNIRNGLGLLNVPGHTQTGVIGLLLILSVLLSRTSSRAIGSRPAVDPGTRLRAGAATLRGVGSPHPAARVASCQDVTRV